MMLGDRGEVKDRVKAFESGADDYVTAPFNSLELKARVGMILRRNQI
jgi:DNA-binding response OmpR family regulator